MRPRDIGAQAVVGARRQDGHATGEAGACDGSGAKMGELKRAAQAKREARHLVEEMSHDQVRARVGREQAAAHDAAAYRATQLA